MNTAEVPRLRLWLATQPLVPLDGKTMPEPMHEVVDEAARDSMTAMARER